jgi:broad specificity polyphosphatase/5'/3'-nucleotidase SurE
LGNIYTVNIPVDPKEIRITRQGGPYYSDDFLPEENDMYRPHGKDVWEDRQDDALDTDATLHGHLTITPLTVNKTNMELFRLLTE